MDNLLELLEDYLAHTSHSKESWFINKQHFAAVVNGFREDIGYSELLDSERAKYLFVTWMSYVNKYGNHPQRTKLVRENLYLGLKHARLVKDEPLQHYPENVILFPNEK